MLVADSGSDGSKILRPIRFSDVVILLRTMRFKAEQFARILTDEGIPVHADSVTGYFESMEVRDMLALLQVLDNLQQDIPLATLLRSPLAGLPEPEDAMARVRVAYPPGATGDVPFHQAVVRYSREKDDELAAHLRDLLETIQQWRDTAQRRPLDELLWNIYQQTGFLALCEGLSNGTQRVANLMLLREKATQFGTFGRQGLARYLDLLESLRDEADLGLPSTATAAQDVVRIMSVHRSKGLEFPVVFLPDLGKGINLDDSRGQILADRQLGLGLCVVDQARFVRYPSLASTLVKSRLRQQSMAEELRVLYVAMTRAKEHLVLVGTASDKRSITGRRAGSATKAHSPRTTSSAPAACSRGLPLWPRQPRRMFPRFFRCTVTRRSKSLPAQHSELEDQVHAQTTRHSAAGASERHWQSDACRSAHYRPV